MAPVPDYNVSIKWLAALEIPSYCAGTPLTGNPGYLL